jgi:hypothetical protein
MTKTVTTANDGFIQTYIDDLDEDGVWVGTMIRGDDE